MAPCGRRKPPSISLWGIFPVFSIPLLQFLLFLACFPLSTSAVGPAVLGIDVGAEYLKAALVKPGIPLEIVPTKDSKRKEFAAVAFKPARESNSPFPERFYGADALALAARFPDDVYTNLKVLLGVHFDEGDNEVVKVFQDRYPALKLESASNQRGTVGLRSPRLGKEEGRDAFLVEEILAMQLKQVKANAEALAGKGTTVKDVVITYPPYYTAEERRSLELAAELAGLEVQALISDGLAVGLNYATSRTFPSVTEGQKPEYHLVYDMGAGSTKATVLRFQSQTVKDVGRFNKTVQEIQVMGTGWDRTLGGDALNQLIVDDMVKKFIQEKSKDSIAMDHVRSHGKTMARLWKDAEKARQILSANSETAITFEGLFEDDVNFKYKITRTQFEALAQGQTDRVRVPLNQALAAAGLDLGDLDSVILHGGTVRTPFVQKQLENACGGSSKLRTSVNADEAAVFGAAFRGAALSPSFRVKDIRVSDAASYSVKVKWNSHGKEKHQRLFNPTSQVGVEKQVTLKILDDFELSFYQQVPSGEDLIDLPVLSVQTKNLTASVAHLKETFGCAPINITTKFSIRLSPVDGLPEVLDGSVGCTMDKKGSVVDDVKEFFGLGSKKGDQEPLKEGDQSAESITLEAESPSTSVTPPVETPTASQNTEENKTLILEPKTKLEISPISLDATPLGTTSLSPAELARIKDRLAAFDASDRERILREEALNDLEAFIYRGRDLVDNEDFIKAMKEDQLSLLKERLEASSDWLYEEGVNAKIQDIRDKFKSLKDIVDPATGRQKENSLRSVRIDVLQGMLKNTKSIIDVMEKQIQSDEELFSLSSLEASASIPTSPEFAPSSTSATTSSTAESSTDVFASLEDDSYSTSASSSLTGSATASSISSATFATPTYSRFTPADLAPLSRAYKSINTWLETQRALQEHLTESDDPALKVADIDGRMHELERAMTRMYEKIGKKSESWSKNTDGESRVPKKKMDKGKNGEKKSTGKEKLKQSRKDEL